MRCKLLHQGRASRDRRGRYSGFSFGQPSGDGVVDHLRVERRVLHLDVDELLKETKDAVERWIKSLETNPLGRKARDVEKHLKSLVKVKPAVIVTLGTGGIERVDTVIKTN